MCLEVEFRSTFFDGKELKGVESRRGGRKCVGKEAGKKQKHDEKTEKMVQEALGREGKDGKTKKPFKKTKKTLDKRKKL